LEIVATALGREPAELTADSGLPTGDWSSLQHLPVLLALAETFGFPLSPRVVQELTTVRAMAHHVEITQAGHEVPPRPPQQRRDMKETIDRLREVLAGANVAVLSSVRPDGRPQQFVVWAEMDGDDVLMSTTKDRPKYRNLEHRPEAALVVYPAGDPYSSVRVRGTTTFTTEGAAETIDRLSHHYKGKPWVEPTGLGERVTVRLTALEPGDD
jgi:PPOX class probable F420-dependent enzyme